MHTKVPLPCNRDSTYAKRYYRRGAQLITLPALEAPGVQRKSQAACSMAKTQIAAAATPVLPSQAPINILIVDDEPKNLTVLEAILDDPGYRLVRAASAEQALLALLADEFGLLILDIRMPDVTGFELAQMIKARKQNANVPIIFLTAYYNEDQHMIEGYDAGALDYLNNPVNLAILRSKVAIFAADRPQQRSLEELNRARL